VVDESPLAKLLEALDRLDLDAATSLISDDVRLLLVDGRRAEGIAAARELIGELLGTLRSTAHRITEEWHVGDVWIAEVEASYELADGVCLTGLPRAFVLRTGKERITEMHAYGAHERPLTDHRTGEEGLRIGDRWIPPL
jgi:SnoaL-like domain